MTETEDLAHRLEHGYPTTERKAAAALLRSQAAEIERLTADNVQTNRLYEETLGFNDEWRKFSMAQATEIERLREALESFTKSDYVKKQHPKRYAAARAALGEQT